MKLVRLEIRNYRSIESNCDDNCITFDGLDCLVGKNNVGKSNILKAIRFLLEGERISEDLHYRRDTSLEIEVRGFFKVNEEDIDLLKIDNKKEDIKSLILDDGTLGICRRSSQKDIEIISLFPAEERLQRSLFDEFHSETWKKNKNEFQQKMENQFPELVFYLTAGKEAQKGEWLNAYKIFLQERPETTEFVLMPGPPPTGLPADLKNMLPDVIFVPAVKEVTDVTNTSSRYELGKLLNELSKEVQEELDEAIDDALKEVYKRLNIVQMDNGDQLDDRHPGVKNIEKHISNYIAETFQDLAISLEFPNPQSKVLFENAKVWINESGFEKTTVENVGEGVKRVLIFSLIRTLADLRQGTLNVSGAEDEDIDGGEKRKPHSRQSLLILYEEAELYLHPGLQGILLRAFTSLAGAGDQVVFTTHSPFMLQGTELTTVNLVNKSPEKGTTVIEFHDKLAQQDESKKNRLLQVQNVSSYIFADKVLLVEGESDKIVIKKLAKCLNSEWDFDLYGIPILPVMGKGDLPLYHNFLQSLNIQTFVMTDIDAIESTILRLSKSEEIKNSREQLLRLADEMVREGELDVRANRKYVKKLSSQYTWDSVFEQLELLYDAIIQEDTPSDEQLGCLKQLLHYKFKYGRTKAVMSDNSEIVAKRNEIAFKLLEENVLYLRGTIENYYPSSGNKIESAIMFDPSSIASAEILEYFCELVAPGETQQPITDIELFLQRIF